jgi:CubicO group peptidase (beta-lactamase class C family)
MMWSLLRSGALIAAALLLGAPAQAGGASEAPARRALPSVAATSAPALEAADLAAFADGFFPYAIGQGDIAGAVVVVVKDGRVLFEKGYGFADVASRKPPDPKKTVFRLGSTSKLMTWTAVMQLVEAGKLDLDRDVNAYLDFKIPPRFGQPVTLRALMTHSAGFEDASKDVMSPNRPAMPSLEAYVKANLPTRIFPPGERVAYSNYGATLAGYIVQRVSGEPFAKYVAQHIFAPLGMAHSTFAQPVPASLDLASGYRLASAGPLPFEYFGDAPAGGLSSTADDMAQFMIAHLSGGAVGSARILQPATAALMHKPAFQAVPPLPAMSLGFYDEDRNGHWIIGHYGDTIAFHAGLHLMPNDGVGLFYAVNSWGANNAFLSIRTAFMRAFLDRYFPGPALQEPTLASAHHDGQRLVGRYSPSLRSDDTLGSLATLFSQGVLTLNPDDTISFSIFTDELGHPKRWREVSPFVWREVGGQSRLAVRLFRGQVSGLTTDDAPVVEEFGPTPGALSAGWNLPLLAAALAVLTLAFFGGGARGLWRRARGQGPSLSASPLRWPLRVAAAANLAFLGGWLWVFQSASANPALLTPQLDPFLRVLQIFGLAGVCALPLTAFATFSAWRSRLIPWPSRVGLAAILLAGAATLWFALAFHLLSWTLKY